MRNVMVAILFSVLCLTGVQAHAQYMEHGQFDVGVQTEGWTLHQGDGTRYYQLIVTFDKPFESAPTVNYGVTGFDAATEKGLRLSVRVEKVTITGFVVKISTWQDSRVFSVSGNWLAIGK